MRKETCCTRWGTSEAMKLRLVVHPSDLSRPGGRNGQRRALCPGNFGQGSYGLLPGCVFFLRLIIERDGAGDDGAAGAIGLDSECAADDAGPVGHDAQSHAHAFTLKIWKGFSTVLDFEHQF